MANSSEVVAFFGLGAMGFPMARHLLKHNYSAACWNRTSSKAEPLSKEFPNQVIIAKDPVDAVRHSKKAVLMMLFDGDMTKEVLSNLPKDVFQKRTFICLSTISLEDSKTIQKLVEDAGGQYMECPVLGNNVVAQNGKLQVMVGGTKDQFSEFQTLLDSFGKARYIGEHGKALACKLALNQLLASYVSGFASSLAIVERAQVPLDSFMEILSAGPLALSAYHQTWNNKMSNRNYSQVAFSLEGLQKDLSLISNLAHNLGVNTSSIDGIKKLAESVKEELGNEDCTVLYEATNPKAQ